MKTNNEVNKLMNRLFTRQTAIAISLFLFLFSVTISQVFAQTVDEPTQAETPQGNQDANWVTALGLSPDQVGRIRRIRQENRFEWQNARQRLNQAQRALDQAIYSDEASDIVIEQRAREVAEAQAAEVRLRAMTELSIRRVLTPQQLNTFRTIRQQRIREAQIRRLENADPQRPVGDRRLENGMNPTLPRRPAGGKPGNRVSPPLLRPRQIRGFPRRIRQ